MEKRIERIMEYYKLTAGQFAEAVGVQPSNVSHILSGRNKPSLDFVSKVLNKFDKVNSDWLIFGKGKMIREDEKKEIFEQPTLFTEGDGDAGKKPERNTVAITEMKEKEKIVSKTIKQRNIERIVLFYSDRTFEEYKPGV